jgi:hypothetical protein
MTAAHEVQLELLLGCEVVAKNDRAVGRIEEICAEECDGELMITEYLIGRYAILERLSVSRIARAFQSLFHLRSGYRIAWDKLDLTDVTRPRLTCSLSELKKMQVG